MSSEINNNTIDDKIIEDVVKCHNLIMSNKIAEAESIVKPYADKSVYYSLINGVIKTLDVMTLDHDKLIEAQNALLQCLQIADKKRRHGLSRFVFKQDYDSYTDEEVHALLCWCEASMLVAVVTCLENPTFMAFVNGALYFRQANSGYKECLEIAKRRKHWTSADSKEQFECGVWFGTGLLDLAISFLPGRFIALLEYVGFTGDRDLGLNRIYEVALRPEGIRYPVATIMLIINLTFAEYLFGLGEPDSKMLYNVINLFNERFPNTGFSDLFTGCIKLKEGDLPSAIKYFAKCINEKTLINRLDTIVLIFLIWTNLFLRDYEQALAWCDQYQRVTTWSPASGVFTRAFVKYAIAEKETDVNRRKELVCEVQEIMKSVKGKKKTFGGKKAFHEKFTLERSELYAKRPELMNMPLYDYAYIFNYTKLFGTNRDHVQAIIDEAEEKLNLLVNDNEYYYDHRANLTFIQGTAFSILNETEKAIDYYEKVLELEPHVTYNKHLAPQACYELGNIYRGLQKYSEAKKWLKKSLKYHGYETEMAVKFRAEISLTKTRQELKSRNS